MKATRKTILALVGAVAMGVASAAPSVEITSVQQQYPWTNTVDITYVVSGVTNSEYFVKFTPLTSDNKVIADVNGQYDIQVALTNSGTHTAQWYPQTNQQYTACKMVPSVYRGAAKDYMIVDLATGDITYEPMAVQSASNERYNTDEYKTTKMVFRRIPKGEYPVRRVDGNWGESGAMATMDRDYYISIFDVTVAQANRLKDAEPYTNLLPYQPSTYSVLRGNALSRASVVPSANGDIIARINYKTGLVFDIPTFAMYQVAAHANASKEWPYFWGTSDADTSKYAWYPENTGKTLKPVGTLAANPWGIFDAYGNTWEVCRDTVPSGGNWNTNTCARNDDVSLTQEASATGQSPLVWGGTNWDPMRWCRTASSARHTRLSWICSATCRLALIVNE